ncbi:unnamed protein product [Darwinula stevensoni]|uniref:guanylate cyclase n=1 Tax=Darwinula stevensoni TaxID=69355 RepID=A0A7R8X170_9CRUS|nr:unnamed protein product [Darwinula stevensoni]CAG0882506.1 unnamed protein product [Darwinula stevensoni]
MRQCESECEPGWAPSWFRIPSMGVTKAFFFLLLASLARGESKLSLVVPVRGWNKEAETPDVCVGAGNRPLLLRLDEKQLRLTVLGLDDPEYPFNLMATSVAAHVGATHATRQVLPGWQVRIVAVSVSCDPTCASLRALKSAESSHGILGPVCSDYVIAPVARFTTAIGVPVLTPGGLSAGLSLKQPQYRLLTRMMGSYDALGDVFNALLPRFHWGNLGIVYYKHADSEQNTQYSWIAQAIQQRLHKDVDVYYLRFGDPEDADFYSKLLEHLSTKARIVVLCASPDRVRSILLAAEELKMMEKGEYVFFNVELFLRSGLEYKPWFDPNDEKNNERAKQAYEAVLTVTARTPTTPEYKNFSDMVKNLTVERSGMEYEEDTVNTFVAAFHDAVLLYAHALNETLREGGDVTNGSDITRRMWNRSIEGITGTVSIDENGDRKADYSLLDMDPKTGVFHVVANYFGVTGELKDVEGKSIHWAGGRDSPPPDTPQCGFDGSLCPDKNKEENDGWIMMNSLAAFPNYAIVIIVLGAFVILLCVASFFIYRHYKLEAELASMTWKVTWSDILDPNFSGNSERKGGKRTGGGGTGSRLNTVAWEEMNKNYPSIKTGIYKGTIVAIKKIKKNRIDITRSLLLELKRMKDLHHDHLVRFIGACVDAPHCCILTEYCPKGSLEDILANDQIKLDWMFRYSLMHDIVKSPDPPQLPHLPSLPILLILDSSSLSLDIPEAESDGLDAPRMRWSRVRRPGRSCTRDRRSRASPGGRCTRPGTAGWGIPRARTPLGLPTPPRIEISADTASE